jgi:uncharacterized protein
VTGASSGIGFELAKQFAANGFDLIVAAEDDELTPARDRIAAAGGVSVEALRSRSRSPSRSRCATSSRTPA